MAQTFKKSQSSLPNIYICTHTCKTPCAREQVNVYGSDYEEAELAAGRKPPSVIAAEAAAAAAKAAKKNGGGASNASAKGNAMPLSFGSSSSGGGVSGIGPTDNASPGSKMTKVSEGAFSRFHSSSSSSAVYLSA